MSVLFDAVDDKITCGSSTTLANISSKTVSLWFLATGPGEGGTGDVISKDGGGVGVWYLYTSGGVKALYYHQFSGADGDWSANLLFSQNRWNHLLLSYVSTSSSNVPLFYINNSLSSLNTATSPTGVVDTDNAASLFIGSQNGGSETFQGQISEVAIWNTSLNTVELDLLSRSRLRGIPLQIRPANLISYWPLDEAAEGAVAATSEMFRDRSANSNNGTPTGNPVGRAESNLSYV